MPEIHLGVLWDCVSSDCLIGEKFQQIPLQVCSDNEINLIIFVLYKAYQATNLHYKYADSPIIQHFNSPMNLYCSVGGLVLDMTVSDKKYQGIAVFQPVMNGEYVR